MARSWATSPAIQPRGEAAEPSQIVASGAVDEEDVDMMVGNADLHSLG